MVGDAVVVELDRPEETVPRRITPLAFAQRFTDAEAIAIDIASRAETQEGAEIRRYLQKVTLAPSVDLDGDNVRQGVSALEELGLLAKGRAAEIMDTPAQPSELA
jgi:hypothetical protein